jgi:quercetin dioxygenase-like cupin family protein
MNVARMLTAIVIALGFAALPLHAQDKPKAEAKAKAEPKAKADAKEIEVETKVLLENDKVRVTQSTFKPGAVSRVDRKARVNYVVTDGKLQRTTKEGKTTTYERKAGTAVWLEADSDVVKNIGTTTFIVVGVVHKVAVPASQAQTPDLWRSGVCL